MTEDPSGDGGIKKALMACSAWSLGSHDKTGGGVDHDDRNDGSAQGKKAKERGSSGNGVTSNGVTSNGVTSNGVTSNGVTSEGKRRRAGVNPMENIKAVLQEREAGWNLIGAWPPQFNDQVDRMIWLLQASRRSLIHFIIWLGRRLRVLLRPSNVLPSQLDEETLDGEHATPNRDAGQQQGVFYHPSLLDQTPELAAALRGIESSVVMDCIERAGAREATTGPGLVVRRAVEETDPWVLAVTCSRLASMSQAANNWERR